MKKYELPFFGSLDLIEGEEIFETEATVDGQLFSIELIFDGEEPNRKSLDRVNRFLQHLLTYLANVKGYIAQEFAGSPSFVADYISFFHESLEENDDMDDYVKCTAKPVEEQLLQLFHLLRIGIYPNEDTFAVLDYTIDEEYTNDLLVVYLNDDGKLTGMTIES